MLLQSKKEFEICAGLTEKDVFFYYTTTGWMMWNFLVSGLSTGATLVLYDGSPLKDPSVLWKMADELKVTVFGTSAKYIDTLSVRVATSFTHDWNVNSQAHRKNTSLRTITNLILCSKFTLQALHYPHNYLIGCTRTSRPTSY